MKFIIIIIILKYGPVIPPHAPIQLESQLFFKVGATFISTDGVPIRIAPVYLIPGPEFFHGHTLSRPGGIYVPVQPHSCLFSYPKYLSKQFISDTLGMRSVYLIPISSSILYVISICSNTPTVRSRKVLSQWFPHDQTYTSKKTSF